MDQFQQKFNYYALKALLQIISISKIYRPHHIKVLLQRHPTFFTYYFLPLFTLLGNFDGHNSLSKLRSDLCTMLAR